MGHVVPVPADGMEATEETDPLKKLTTDIAGLKGGTALVPTTSGGFGAGDGAAPRQDWRSQRIGADPPDILATLRSDAAQSVLSACGVPLALASDRTEGAGLREGFRQFVAISVAPVAALVAAELSRKLETPVEIDFTALSWRDEMGRARAVGSRAQAVARLVEAGVNVNEARRLSGLGDG